MDIIAFKLRHLHYRCWHHLAQIVHSNGRQTFFSSFFFSFSSSFSRINCTKFQIVILLFGFTISPHTTHTFSTSNLHGCSLSYMQRACARTILNQLHTNVECKRERCWSGDLLLAMYLSVPQSVRYNLMNWSERFSFFLNSWETSWCSKYAYMCMLRLTLDKHMQNQNETKYKISPTTQ